MLALLTTFVRAVVLVIAISQHFNSDIFVQCIVQRDSGLEYVNWSINASAHHAYMTHSESNLAGWSLPEGPFDVEFTEGKIALDLKRSRVTIEFSGQTPRTSATYTERGASETHGTCGNVVFQSNS